MGESLYLILGIINVKSMGFACFENGSLSKAIDTQRICACFEKVAYEKMDK